MIMSANVQDQVQSILKSIQNVLAKVPTTKVVIWVWQQYESNALTIWLGMFRAPWYCCDGCACDRSTKVVLAGPIGLGGGYRGCCCCCSGSILDLAVFGCGDSAGGEVHRQCDSSHLELSPVASGHSQSEIRQPGEETVTFRITGVWWWTPVIKVACRFLHHCHELAVMAGLLSWGYLLFLLSGSLHGFPNARWRCQRRMKKLPWFFSCVARATVVAVIGAFFWLSVCWWGESAEHRTSFGLLECLLTLLVERSQEGVSFIFPFLQSREVFILSLARLAQLAFICNIVVISPAALESSVDLVRPGFVIWNIKTRVSVRTHNTNDQQQGAKLMKQL